MKFRDESEDDLTFFLQQNLKSEQSDAYMQCERQAEH